MMRAIAAALVLIGGCVALTGCWGKVELVDRGFVMGVAIDRDGKNQVQLTTQFYTPGHSAGDASQSTGRASFNIVTTDENVFEAVRDIPIQLGRRPQWSHMRVIVISRDFAESHDVADVLDVFNRDHEPRLTTPVVISEGKAADCLDVVPDIESTSSQELMKAMRSAANLSAKSVEMDVLNLDLQLHSETKVAIVPYVRIKDSPKQFFLVEGVALLKEGRMVAALTSAQSESLLLLLNKYKYGIIKVPCAEPDKGKHSTKDALEVISAKTALKTKASADSVDVRISVLLNGSVGELRCSDVTDPEAELAFIENAQKAIAKDMKKTMEQLQNMKADVLGVGNQVFRQNPQLWRRWKDDWGDRFARARVDCQVKVIVTDTGMFSGKPIQ